MDTIAMPLLLSIGALLALQAAANVQVATALASPFGAATLQLGLASGLLLAASAVAGALGVFGELDGAEAWHLLGGIGSALYITAGILLFPRLGAVVAVGLFVAGQMAASLALDATGWLGVQREALGAAALAGAAAVGVGIALVVRAQAGEAAAGIRRRYGWLLLGLAAGAVLPVQGAINAQLRADLDAPFAVGSFSFMVATATMTLLLAALLAVRATALPRVRCLETVPWWGWLGGLCGAAYVVAVFAFIPEIGVAPTVALTIAGQQIASLAVDRFGALRLPRRRISARRAAGVALLSAGVLSIQLA